MPTNSRLGAGSTQLGNLELTAVGYDGIVTVPVTALTRGTFVATIAVSGLVSQAVKKTIAVTGQVSAQRINTVAVTAQVKSTSVRTVPVTALVQGNLILSVPVVGLVQARRGPVTVPTAAALFPAQPETYTGRVPRRSTLMSDLLTLFPQYYDVQPDAVRAMTVGIATSTAPQSATSPLVQRYNPLAAPVARAAESVGGELTSGTYDVGYTFYSSLGETALSPTTSVNIDRQRAMGIAITGIPIPDGLDMVRIYLRSPVSNVFSLAAVSITGQSVVLVREGETVTVRIEGSRFEMVATDNELPAFACDLRDFTLNSLAYQLQNSGYVAAVAPGWESLAATVLVDQFNGPSANCDLDGFTSTLWRILRPIALCFDQWADDLDEAARQMDIRYATGRWLNWWGILYGVERRAEELDSTYRRRITWEVMAPRTNNVAMEIILKEALGYDATISDMAGSTTTWYSNRVSVGTIIRNAIDGSYVRLTTDPQGEFVPGLGLTSWDYNASYNTSTRTWTASDYQPLTWGLKIVGATDVEADYITKSWPGSPGRFHVDVRQVVEDGELGVEEIRGLINRYKAAGFLFTLSVLTYYREEYQTGKEMHETYREDWQEMSASSVGQFHTTMTMASLTMQLTPPPLREASIIEEWSYDNGVIFLKEGSTVALSPVVALDTNIPRLLGGATSVKRNPPGVVPTG